MDGEHASALAAAQYARQAVHADWYGPLSVDGRIDARNASASASEKPRAPSSCRSVSARRGGARPG